MRPSASPVPCRADRTHLKGNPVSELKIAIILGSTRPNRNGKAVADWDYDRAVARIGAEYDLIDLCNHPGQHPTEPKRERRGGLGLGQEGAANRRRLRSHRPARPSLAPHRRAG